MTSATFEKVVVLTNVQFGTHRRLQLRNCNMLNMIHYTRTRDKVARNRHCMAGWDIARLIEVIKSIRGLVKNTGGLATVLWPKRTPANDPKASDPRPGVVFSDMQTFTRCSWLAMPR